MTERKLKRRVFTDAAFAKKTIALGHFLGWLYLCKRGNASKVKYSIERLMKRVTDRKLHSALEQNIIGHLEHVYALTF